MNLINKNKIATVLDITPKQIKLMLGDIEAAVSLVEGSVIDGVIADVNGVAEIIKNLFRSQNITNKNVIISVGGNGVMLHLSNVPLTGPEEIRNIIRSESSKYPDFAGSELLTDFSAIEEVSEQENRKLKVLSVTVKKEIIDSCVEAIESAGLNLQAIDVSTLAVARAVFAEESISSGIVVLAVVEYENATFFIFKDGKIHYLHNIDSVTELNSEMESILEYCRSEFGGDVKIKKIVSTDVEGVSVEKGLALREHKENRFTVKVNLLPVEVISDREFSSQVFLFVKSLGIITAVLLFYFFFLLFQTKIAYKNIAAIQDDFKMPTPTIDELLEIERMDKIYNLETENQDKIMLKAKEKDAVGILEEIKRIIPQKASLSDLNIDEEGRVAFKGEAVNSNTIYDFVDSIEKSAYFKDVKLQESKVIGEKGETGNYFIIECQLNPDKTGL